MKTRKAFTLVELLIVIVIIAVLAAIAVPRFIDSAKRSKEASIRSNLSLMRDGVARFKSDTGLLPASLADLTAKTPPAKGLQSDGSAATLSNYQGPYLDQVPTNDPFGSAYQYSTAGKDLGAVTCSTAAYADW